MRVLFVSHAAKAAGAEAALAVFAGELKRRGWDPVVSSPARGPLTDRLDVANVPWFVAPFEWRLPEPDETPDAFLQDRLERASLLATFYRAAEPDVVVVNTAVIPEAVLAATLAERPVVLHAHGLISRALIGDLNTAAWRAAEDAAVSFADGLVAPSAWTTAFFHFAHGVPEGRVSLIPNLVTDADAIERTSPGETIVQLGVLEDNKNQAMLVRALARLRDRGATPTARLIGDAVVDYRKTLVRRIAEADLADQVRLEPRTADTGGVYRDAGVVVVTSRLESFSRVCLEAMAHGRPVISTRCGGPEDLIEDGVTGFLVDGDDDKALAERLMDLLGSPALRARMGAAGREAVMTRYTPDAVMPSYMAALERAATTGGPNAMDWPARRARAFSSAGAGPLRARWGDGAAPTATRPAVSAPQAAISADAVAARLVADEVRRRDAGPAVLKRWRNWRSAGDDLTPTIERSWFAPWLTSKGARERIVLSPFLRAGETRTYALTGVRPSLSGLDVAAQLWVGAEGALKVAALDVLSPTGERLAYADADADRTTGQDSLRFRFEPIEAPPPSLTLRFSGLAGADVVGLAFYERVVTAGATRRIASRALFCAEVYGS